MPFYPGSSVKLTATFTVDEVNTDPTTITLLLRTPNGTITTSTYAGGGLVKQSTGVYYKNVNLDAEGRWEWRWVGTGSCVSAQEGGIDVELSVFV